jgi:serine/threonine protein kinase
VIHRDIKAENFLYKTKESPIDDFQLIDFGISKVHPFRLPAATFDVSSAI